GGIHLSFRLDELASPSCYWGGTQHSSRKGPPCQIRVIFSERRNIVKFQREISENILIKAEARQGDGLAPLQFNLVLDKVIKEWEEELNKQRYKKPIKLERLKHNNEETAIKQIDILKESMGRVDLRILFEKTEFFCSKLQTQTLITIYGGINRVAHFKYLGEIVEPTGGEKLHRRLVYRK
ncbi:hypothetical protein HHI36_005013, partial [Cryptolaemus montrouzieri]